MDCSSGTQTITHILALHKFLHSAAIAQRIKSKAVIAHTRRVSDVIRKESDKSSWPPSANPIF